MKTSLVSTHNQGAVQTITLNRPQKLNAINAQLVSALCAALLDANQNQAIKVIVLRGAGRAFCAGADLTGASPRNAPTETQRDQQIEMNSYQLQEVTRQIVFSNKIVIAAVHGWAVGAGLEWVINCDFSIWAQSAKGFFPEAQWGLSVTGAVTSLLPALVGPLKARELILLGEKHTAQEFHRMGVAWKVVADDQIDREVVLLSQRLTALLPRTLSTLKRAINLGSYHDLEKALAFEHQANIEAIKDPQTLKRVYEFSRK